MADFKTFVYVIDPDGGEHEIPVRVDYDAINDHGDAWNPPFAEMTITSIEPVQDTLPHGITDEMVRDACEATIEDECWEHYSQRGVDDCE